VSSGAKSGLPTITVGRALAGSWDSGAAPLGLVYITNYTDSVRAERGSNQETSAASFTRTGRVYYWNGSSYSSFSISPTTSRENSTVRVTYDAGGGAVQILAEATVRVDPRVELPSAPGTDCSVERCSINASNGAITITLRQWVAPGGTNPFLIESITRIQGSSATAGFTEPEVTG
jgi:hypothetical protein